MKCSFLQEVAVSILLYGCTAWKLTKRMEKRLDGKYTRMLAAILKKAWTRHPTKQHLYGHLPPIMKTTKARRTRHAGHCCRSKDELISDILLWTPSRGRAKAGRPARNYIQQLCADTGYSSEDLLEAMDDREGWRERVRDIRADCVNWWWWWWNLCVHKIVIYPETMRIFSDKLYIYIYIYEPGKHLKYCTAFYDKFEHKNLTILSFYHCLFYKKLWKQSKTSGYLVQTSRFKISRPATVRIYKNSLCLAQGIWEIDCWISL